MIMVELSCKKLYLFIHTKDYMKHILLIFFLGILALPLVAQESVFSALKKNISTEYPLLSITENPQEKEYQVVTFHEKNDSYQIHLEILDSALVKKSETDYVWKKGANDKIQFLGSVWMNSKYHSFFSVVTESTMKNELVVAIHENGSIEIKSIDQFDIRSVTNFAAYKISASPHQKNILVIRESLVEKGKNESIQLMVLDDKLNKITDLSLSFSVPSKPNPVNKALVSDKGDIFIIKKDREKTEYKFYLYAYNNELKGWNQKQISIPGKMISDIDACLNTNQEFIVSGFYNTMDVSSYEGYFYYRFDNSLKYASKVNNRFTAEFMTNFIGKKAASKEDAVITGYWFENLIAAPDNNSYLIAEIEEFENAGGLEIYKYGDILYLQLDKEGNIKNSGSLKNKQETQNDKGEWSSFNYAVAKDTLHLFHNEVNPSESKTKFTDATFYGTYHSKLIKANPASTLPEKEMVYKGEDKLAFHPEYVYQTSDEHLIFLLLSKDKSSYALGKMKLK